MEVGLLQKQLLDLTTTLVKNGFLDKQFVEIQSMSDSSNPDFALDVINDYFEDAQKLVNELHKTIEHRFANCKEISDYAHRLKGSSANVGLKRIADLCKYFVGLKRIADFCKYFVGLKRIADLCKYLRECCDRVDLSGCCSHLQQIKCDLSIMKSELQKIFDMQKQILAAGGSLPKIQG